ncbi:IMPACT family protein [Pleomorphovibrio marinus]|uniref:IMPACT family protein n=1 Tax=Pleomorphovibrio marinus TaxID=2164132 RepID=UPI000E0CBC1A|nr:YigZ family protein [Pleomorphovibrio marinus]
MLDNYRTLNKESKGEYKEKGSKFLSFAIPVKNIEEIKFSLEAIKKTYYDARHHCYAYMLGKEGDVFRANDDGEPNHSAGDPILGQIRAFDVTNILVVVVRYFGGTKLGVGGLINAYRTAAKEALQNSEIIEAMETAPITFTFGYEETNKVMAIIGEYQVSILSQEFTEQCKISIDCPKSRLSEIREAISELSSTKILFK